MSAKRVFYFILCFSALFISRPALAILQAGEKIIPPVIWKEAIPPVFSRFPGGIFAPHRLTSATGSHVAPRLSPCLKKVLFNSFRGGRMGVWMVDFRGEREERIADGEQASWSPEGERIIFRREGKIVERVLASGEERIISFPGFRDSSFPGYSPDGEKMLFIEEEERIYIFKPGEEPRHLLDLSPRDIRCAPRWSPDGKRITFQDRGRIYVIDRDGSNRRRLTTAGGIQASPLWSLCGRGIIYCQASNPEGPWDLYIVGVDDGREPRRRMRKVDLSPDWRVEYFGEGLPLQIGSHLHLREIGETSLSIENDWFTLSLSPEGAFLLPQEGGERIEFVLFPEKDERLLEIGRLQILRNDSEEIIIEAHYYQRGLRGRWQRWLGRPVKITYRILRTRPIVEVLPGGNSGKIHIKAEMHFVLLPDRLASDLILDPARYSASRVPLPSTDLALGLLGGGNSLLLVSSPERMELTRDEQVFTGLEVPLEGGSFSLAILTGKGLWDLKEEAQEDFRTETPGIYRLALYREGIHHTKIFSAGERKKISLPEGWERPELAISYLYSRTERTPSHLLTIMDIRKEIEERPLREILERENLLAYRISQRKPDPGLAEVPERLTTHRPIKNWIEYPHISFIIESLRSIYFFSHGKEYISHLCGVIERFIEEMNRRLDQYRNFTGQIDSLLEVVKRETPKRGKFIEELEKMKKELHVLQERRLHFKPKEDLSKHLESIRQAEADHASFNILFDALVEHRELLRAYKALAMNLRDSAGMAITREPAIRELAEEIRKSTEVIGRRHFLEKKELLVIFPGWGADPGRASHVVNLLLE